jgi:CDGSH-type Zn-finger protein
MEVIIVKIKALPNGPYLAESKEKGKVALCRCGQSKNKPYCDGSHAQANFKADSAEIDL